MSVSIKTEHEIELMREAGHLLEKVHDGLIPYIKPGVSTKEIDRIGEQMIRDLGCIPNFLNYGGFPASFCISLNDEVVHGIPSEEKIIQEGDLVKIDAGLIYKGYHSDAARTYAVGEVSPQARKLMDVTRECFFEGLKAARAGNHLNDISKQSVLMLPNIIMGLSATWLDMESALTFMRIRRSRISAEAKRSSSDAGYDTCCRAYDQSGTCRCGMAG